MSILTCFKVSILMSLLFFVITAVLITIKASGDLIAIFIVLNVLLICITGISGYIRSEYLEKNNVN